jgi:RES domain-containing protein
MHVPRWAVAPTSGAGAAKLGGRANRPGVEALYLALETETAVREYQQVSTLLPPGTLTSYKLTAAPVVDFTVSFSASVWEPIWEDFYCDWRELWFNQRVEPPSWVVGDTVIAAGVKGILFPSRLAKGGTNLVLFTHNAGCAGCVGSFRSGKGTAADSGLSGLLVLGGMAGEPAGMEQPQTIAHILPVSVDAVLTVMGGRPSRTLSFRLIIDSICLQQTLIFLSQF